MLTVYYKMKIKLMRNSGQVTPFMTLVIAVLLLAIAATMLIGEVGFQRIRLANVDDSALISGTSGFCRSLNQIRMLHTRMLLNYLQLQVALLMGSPWPSKNAGYAAALGWSLIGIEMNMEMKAQADTIAEDMPKNLRVGLYDSILGGALVDEPKPFLEEEEIERDPNTGRIIKIDYDKYLNRDSHFTLLLRDFKKGTGDFAGNPHAGKDKWYKNNLLSYSFNKTKEKVLAQPGELSIGEPSMENFESYLRTKLDSIPSNVSVECQMMVLIFFYCTPKGCWYPGFIPHPCAWIRRIDMDSNNFGVEVKKSIPFRRLPFFPRDVELAHKNRIRVNGSVWTGFDFRMEEAR